MNDEAARQGRHATTSIVCVHCSPDDGPTLGVYGGLQAVRCDHCGHISPTQRHLDQHLLTRCCGLWAEWKRAA
jgi:hypothetical protein